MSETFLESCCFETNEMADDALGGEAIRMNSLPSYAPENMNRGRTRQINNQKWYKWNTSISVPCFPPLKCFWIGLNLTRLTRPPAGDPRAIETRWGRPWPRPLDLPSGGTNRMKHLTQLLVHCVTFIYFLPSLSCFARLCEFSYYWRKLSRLACAHPILAIKYLCNKA